MFGHKKHTGDIHPHDLFKVRKVCFCHRAHQADAGIIDEDIEMGKMLEDMLHGFFAGDIAMQRPAAGQFGGQGFRLGGVNISDDDAGPGTAKR